MDFTAERKAMVDSQVRVNDVTDRAIHLAMMAVPREKFCAPDRGFAAYSEEPVVIAGERRLMPARDVAKLLQAADAREGEKALAIAAPYAAALLARMGVSVTAQESDDAVFAVVGEALSDAGVATVVAPLAQPTGEGWDLIIPKAASRACPNRGARPCVPAAGSSWSNAAAPSARRPCMFRRAKACRAANCSIRRLRSLPS